MLFSHDLWAALPAVLALAAQPASALPGSTTECARGQPGRTVAKAVYVLTNDEVNAVAALRIQPDGTLGGGTVTKTGGAGSVAVDDKGQPATPDALVSQSALKLVGRNIFAVNAGSNTLSMLAISSQQDPTRLSPVGSPVSVPGEFPNTVAASAKNRLVCVGTTGAVAGVSCSRFSASGLSPMDKLRPFNLSQTTPPAGPLNTVSHAFFSQDESFLLTTVKGDPAKKNTGFLSAFEVNSRAGGALAPAAAEVRSSPDGTAVLFGSAIIPGGRGDRVFATDASFGAAILSVDRASCKARTVAMGKIDGQKATCWVAISAATNTAFVTDVGQPRIVEMSLRDASIVSILDLSATGDPGFIDLAAAGSFVYALSPGNGTSPAAITVVDVSGGAGKAKMVQHFALDKLAGKRAMGMAVLA